jgi:E3 ubiquitin-protein ligase UBR1
MDPDLLKAFLVDLPSNLQFTNSQLLRQIIFKALYYGASDEGRQLKQLFPTISDQELDSLKDYGFELTGIHKRPFYDAGPTKKYTHPSNRACARSFQKREAVYRCEECGFDETCVLCHHCFNKDDHIGHNVSMYMSTGDSGGVCDCGDLEAFPELNCKCLVEYKSDNSWNPVLDSLKNTIRVCLDYVLDVTNFSISTLPYIRSQIDKGGPLTSQRLSNYSSLPSGKYGGAIDKNSDDLWYLVFWNDEYHTYPEANAAIMAATGLSEVRANDIAKNISDHGKCIVLESKNQEELLAAQRKASQLHNLVTTIMSARDHMREAIVSQIIKWLLAIIDHQDDGFRELSRQHLLDLLFEPGFRFAKDVPAEFIGGSLLPNSVQKSFENGLTYDGKLVNGGLTSVKPFFDENEMIKPTLDILVPNKKLDTIRESRIQFLLAFTIRFAKPVRQNLTKLLIPPILADPERKEEFAIQFMEVYPNLFTAAALVDREDELDVISEVSSQLFSCPTTVSGILSRNEIGYILGPLAHLIEVHSAKWDEGSDYPNFIDISDRKIELFRSIKKTIARGLHSIGVLAEYAPSKVHHFLSHDNLVMLLLVIRNFQGYWSMQKKYGEHVARELYDFVVHIEYSLPVLNFVKNIACCEAPEEDIQSSLKQVVHYLYQRKIKKNAPGISDFRVSLEPVSFVHPMNTMVSYMIHTHGIERFQEYLTSLPQPFTQISDISLRSIVLGSQIKTGFWIRNGISSSRQASFYLESIMNEGTFFRDFHLNQVAAILDDPKVTFFNFLDRWELLQWYLNEVNHDKTVYEDRFASIVERFVSFMYNLVTDRSSFLKLSHEERVLIKAKKSIIYALSDKPISYSSLKAHLDTEIKDLPQFDEILLELADYQAPSALADSGMYRLKKKILESLDPLSLYLDLSKFHTVSETLVKNIAASKNIKEDEVVLIPEITDCDVQLVNEKIGRFAKTKEFAKLIYKLLQLAIDTSEEMYLPHLLHLVHALLKDDELLHGKEYLNENFIIIPISDLLLTLVDSSMSSHIVRKADYLVVQFVLKDKRIVDNLVDCFGEEYLQSYKKRKTGLFESETEKKKRQSDERKARVMKKFAKQREKFLSQNQEYAEPETTPTTESEESEPLHLRTCVLCGDSESFQAPFGFLATITKAASLWKVEEAHTVFSSLAFGLLNDQKTTNNNEEYGKGYNYMQDETPLSNGRVEALVFNSCGHPMHYECYSRACGNSKHFPCPLCHNLQEFFIPSYVSPPIGGISDDECNREPINNKYNQIMKSSSSSKSRKLVESLVHEDYFKPTSEFKSFARILSQDLIGNSNETKHLVGINNNEKYFNKLQNLSVMIADTIRMNEIATRPGGEDSLSDFLDQLTSPVRTLLKSLLQCRAVLYECRSTPVLLGTNYDLSFEIQSFWESGDLLDGVFDEIVLIFFQTDESFRTIARLGYVKSFTTISYALLKRIQMDTSFLDLLRVKDHQIDTKTVTNLRLILTQILAEIEFEDFDLTDMVVQKLYFSIERLLLPLLRQMIIFEDILTSKSDESASKFKDLKHEIKSQEYLDSSRALTTALNIPSLSKLITMLALEDVDFENKIFEITLQAKIPKFMDSGILTLEYPGIVHLIELPSDYYTCIINNDEGDAFNKIICLQCGKKIKSNHNFHHMLYCASHTGIFFIPKTNSLRICIHLGHCIEIPAPYLTVHGEVKRSRTGGTATLFKYRYDYLNKIWLNQGLYGFVTRSLFGARNPENFTGNISEDDDEDEDEDEDDIINEEDDSFL